ncbi:MAG TPA: NfeD family protein [Steroidobacteraceae bacterium]|nr:NfeD family protein [Steroidobacteraceae bacterium]
MSGFANMLWWHWIVIAVVLAAAETFLPGAVAIWFAASAAFIGLVMAVFSDLPWQYQWLGFAILGIVAMLLYRSYRNKYPEVTEQPNLNQRGAQYIGAELVLVEAIEQGQGRARLGDGVWKVEGPELPAGARVRVTGARGAILTVVSA